ncbi:hypothetical protein BSU04_04145 [Caballeronia sordidicola]|uniref:Uncharacterized protein n=1 Tax=Caballeronia sordidicola TaxID=196367 RepID=A0A226XAM0_CABSO|nr:hypothetical protein BSU04_04145 [Caballeronia sordidicola]
MYKNPWTEPERLNVAPGLRLLVAGEMYERTIRAFDSGETNKP